MRAYAGSQALLPDHKSGTTRFSIVHIDAHQLLCREIVARPLLGSEVIHVSMMFKQIVYLFPGSWTWIWI
jgi:hypothetical protein